MTTQTCTSCDSPGDGNCSACHGRGKITGPEVPGAFDELGRESACSVCGGSGECQTCAGLGEVEVGGEA